jgi:SAM-dependent methyltransferase
MAGDNGVTLSDLSDLRTPWCLHVAATLRIADHLAEHPTGGPMPADELAGKAACDPEWLARVLRHLASRGVFTEPQPDYFGLNALADQLRDPANRIGLDLNGIGGRMAHAWSSLLTAVRTGRPAYDQVFGLPFWQDLDANPDIAASFDALMGPAGHGTPDPDVLLTDDWAEVRTVVDVGGGTGSLLAEILRARRGVHGILVDLPRTVSSAVETFREAGVANRVETVAQSFFDELPAGADLYVLKSILNDWPDTEATAILGRCADAAAPDGRIVVIGGVSPDDQPGRLEIETVLVGGKSRTLARFADLAAASNLTVEAAGPLRSGRFAVQCRHTAE